jgi:hypothetical protein
MKNKFGIAVLSLSVISAGLLVTGCSPKSANSLIRQARRDHGPCEVVSQTTDDEGSVVVLRDELQGFEYQVSSNMADINIDGASFGSVPSSSDSFNRALHYYVLEDAAAELEDICAEYGLTEEESNLEDCYWYSADPEFSDEQAQEGIEKIADVFQRYNLESRMDGWTIYLEHSEGWLTAYYEQLMNDYEGEDIYNDSEYSYLLSSAGGGALRHIGSVRLPDTSFRDPAKEDEDYYLEMAQMKDPDAVFIRSEEIPFSDTGADLYNVVETYDQSYPRTEDDMVMIYYFEADGQEFFICNFLVNNRVEYGEWYSNYGE